MPDTVDVVESARAAHARHDWPLARDGFLSVDADLTSDDLAMLANAVWWLGDVEAANRYMEDAHREFLAQGRAEDAASAAMELAVNHFLKGDDTVGSGWMGRAFRLVDELPQGPIHGYLTYVLEVEANFGSVDPSGVIDAARRVRELGRRFGDPNLVAAGLSGEGRMLIKHGSISEGMSLIDEAMVAVMAGELIPDWAGNIYCNAIAACHEVADLRRMKRWISATERWLAQLPAAVLFAGICRVHRAQVMCLTGRWAEAESEAARVRDELAGISMANVAEAWYQIGEVRRLRGDVALAADAYRQAHQNGRDPQPGLALLRLAEGRVPEAKATIGAALLAASGDRLACARLYAAQVDIAIAAGDLNQAREGCLELADIAAVYATSGLEALAASAQGALALAEGRPDDALPVLRDACRRWRDLEAPYEAARTCVLLAANYRTLGDTATAALEQELAMASFSQLGAALDLARMADAGDRRVPGGLSERESEVLALVAAGQSNRAIAEALFISPKTVARHLSNIYTKLGVATRTEAARFAFDHGFLPADL